MVSVLPLLPNSYLTCPLPRAFAGHPAPQWIHLLNGLATVIYVNLDCIDGKQVGCFFLLHELSG